LNYKITDYQANSGSTNLTDTNKHVKQLKTEFEWIKESHSKVIQQTLINLETAYKNFSAAGPSHPAASFLSILFLSKNTLFSGFFIFIERMHRF
jgi:hypothetical protein